MKKEGENQGGREEAGEGERREEGEQGGDYSAHVVVAYKTRNITPLHHTMIYSYFMDKRVLPIVIKAGYLYIE